MKFLKPFNYVQANEFRPFLKCLYPNYSFTSRIYAHEQDLAVNNLYGLGRCPSDEMLKAMDCGIVVSEFKLQSYYNVQFQTNIFGKCMNPLILPAIG